MSTSEKPIDKANDAIAAVSRRAYADGSRPCIVCSNYIYWPELKTLPPACSHHRYDEIFELIEPLPDGKHGG